MKVRCIRNGIRDIADQVLMSRLKKSINRDDEDPDLTIGQEYFVQAVAQWMDGGIRVYLDSVVNSGFPRPYPVEFFEIVDPGVPLGWCVGFRSVPQGMSIQCISFREWALDENFYERLVDGDDQAEEIYLIARNGGPKVMR
jgi:hypothetical protein